MGRFFWIAACSLLLTACAAPLPQTPPSSMAGEVAAPAITPGATWRYAVTDGFTGLSRGTIQYRIAHITADTMTVDVRTETQESRETYTRDWNWLVRPATNMQAFIYKPAYRALDFPLVAGKRWVARSTATDPEDGRSFPVRIEAEVLGWERIKVPAGEFDAVKVQRHVFLDYWLQGVRGQSVIRETDWYAPALNQVARRETTSRYLRLAQQSLPLNLVRVRGNDRSDGATLPRYEQDDWLVYELIQHSAR